jgi:hypothetical protein
VKTDLIGFLLDAPKAIVLDSVQPAAGAARRLFGLLREARLKTDGTLDVTYTLSKQHAADSAPRLESRIMNRAGWHGQWHHCFYGALPERFAMSIVPQIGQSSRHLAVTCYTDHFCAARPDRACPFAPAVISRRAKQKCFQLLSRLEAVALA